MLNKHSSKIMQKSNCYLLCIFSARHVNQQQPWLQIDSNIKVVDILFLITNHWQQEDHAIGWKSSSWKTQISRKSTQISFVDFNRFVVQSIIRTNIGTQISRMLD